MSEQTDPHNDRRMDYERRIGAFRKRPEQETCAV